MKTIKKVFGATLYLTLITMFLISCGSGDSGSGGGGGCYYWGDGCCLAEFQIIDPDCQVTSWETTIGGIDDDTGISVQQTSDRGYIIAGTTESYGAGKADVYLVKTDMDGIVMWETTFGGTEFDNGMSAQQTLDGGYIVVGLTLSYGSGGYDVYLIKTDGSGNKIWDKTYGGAQTDNGYSVKQLSDSGYIVAGSTYSYGAGNLDVYLIRTDNTGNIIWERTFGYASIDNCKSLSQTSDGGFILVGASYDTFGDSNIYVIKTDSNGNKLWEKTFGGYSIDWGNSIQQTMDGGYIILGATNSFGAGNIDGYVIRTDGNGNKLWEKTFGGIKRDEGQSIQETSDGDFIIVGGTDSNVYLIKIDEAGNKEWEKTFGGDYWDYGFSVGETTDGGYIITGSKTIFTDSYTPQHRDVYLIKTDGNGNIN